MDWLWKMGDYPNYFYKHRGDLDEPDTGFRRNARWIANILGRMDAATRVMVESDLLATEAVDMAGLVCVKMNRKSVMRVMVDEMTSGKTMEGHVAEKALVEFILDVYRNFDEPITWDRLVSWRDCLVRAGFKSGKAVDFTENVRDKSPADSGTETSKPPTCVPADRLRAETDRFIALVENRVLKSHDASGPVTAMPPIFMYVLHLRPFRDGSQVNLCIAIAVCMIVMMRRLGHGAPIGMSGAMLANRYRLGEILRDEIDGLSINKLYLDILDYGMTASERTLRVVERRKNSSGAFQDIETSARGFGRACITWLARMSERF